MSNKKIEYFLTNNEIYILKTDIIHIRSNYLFICGLRPNNYQIWRSNNKFSSNLKKKLHYI